MTPEFLEAVLDGDRTRAGELLEVELPDGFPREGGKRFSGTRVDMLMVLL